VREVEKIERGEAEGRFYLLTRKEGRKVEMARKKPASKESKEVS